MVAADPHPRDSRQWRLARGVWLVEGTVVGGEEPLGTHAYTVVVPSGRRYRLSEPLYRLAELLERRLSLDEIAEQLATRLARPVAAAAVAALLERKLAPQGIAVPQPDHSHMETQP